MRLVLTLAAALTMGGLALGTGSGIASPLSSLTAMSSALTPANTAVETVGWRRRYLRRHGAWPMEPIVNDDVIVETDAGDVVVVVPVRPASCGEYRYWDGVACVDARYNDPDLGPK